MYYTIFIIITEIMVGLVIALAICSSNFFETFVVTLAPRAVAVAVTAHSDMKWFLKSDNEFGFCLDATDGIHGMQVAAKRWEWQDYSWWQVVTAGGRDRFGWNILSFVTFVWLNNHEPRMIF